MVLYKSHGYTSITFSALPAIVCNSHKGENLYYGIAVMTNFWALFFDLIIVIV